MSMTERRLDRTPDRPSEPLADPANVLVVDVEIDEAHLANPSVAVSRLLASEAQLFSRVVGDDRHLRVLVALPDPSASTTARAEAWIRWALHNAGVRGASTLDGEQAAR